MTETSLKSRLERSATWWERVKNIVEIAAILIGGGWAYFTFNVNESPDIKKSFSWESSVDIDTAQNNKCQINTYVKLKNTGKSDATVTRVKFTKWIVSSESIIDQKESLFDIWKFVNKIGQSLPSEQYDYKNSDENILVGNYGYDAVADHNFPLFVNYSYDSACIILVDIDIEKEVGWWVFKNIKKDTISLTHWVPHCVKNPDKNDGKGKDNGDKD